MNSTAKKTIPPPPPTTPTPTTTGYRKDHAITPVQNKVTSKRK